jgi:hypothetical protein
VTDLRQSPQGTPLLFPRRHPQLSVISPGDASYAVGQRLVTKDDDVIELVTLLRKLVNGLRTLVP